MLTAEKHVVRQFYILAGLASLGTSTILSVYVTFLMSHNLTLFEINLVNMVFYLTLFVCQLPCGAFADIFGRKRSFVIACFLSAIGLFTYGFSQTFAGFVTAELILALASTFKGGALIPWFVDSMKHAGVNESQTKRFSYSAIICQMLAIVSTIIGSQATSYSMVLPWCIGGSCMLFLGMYAQATMTEHYFVPSRVSLSNNVRRMWQNIYQSYRYCRENVPVRFVLVSTGLQIFTVQALNMYWQPFFAGHGVDKVNFGFIGGTILCCLLAGAYVVRQVSAQHEKFLLILSQVLVALCMIVAAIAPTFTPAIMLFLLHEVWRGCWRPLNDGYLQANIPSEQRSSVTAFCNSVPNITGAIGLASSGFLTKYVSISVVWCISGGILILGTLWLTRLKRA